MRYRLFLYLHFLARSDFLDTLHQVNRSDGSNWTLILGYLYHTLLLVFEIVRSRVNTGIKSSLYIPDIQLSIGIRIFIQTLSASLAFEIMPYSKNYTLNALS